MQPFFSVVIPTLNEEKFLPRLLRCLGRQTFKNFEVIVVDSRSTDRTVALAKNFQKKLKKDKIPLSLVVSPKRSSAYQRNLGAKKAVGSYLVFFDADVIFYDNFLEVIKEKLERYNWQNNLVTTWARGDEDSLFGYFITLLFILLIEIGRLIGKPLSAGFNTIVAKSVFFKIGGFDPKVNVTDDYDFSLRAHQKGYHLKIIRPFKIYFSLRRFRSRGFLLTLFEYFQMAVYNFFKGPPKERVFDYPMGGNQYENNC